MISPPDISLWTADYARYMYSHPLALETANSSNRHSTYIRGHMNDLHSCPWFKYHHYSKIIIIIVPSSSGAGTSMTALHYTGYVYGPLSTVFVTCKTHGLFQVLVDDYMNFHPLLLAVSSYGKSNFALQKVPSLHR